MLKKRILAQLEHALLHRETTVSDCVLDVLPLINGCSAKRHPYGFVVFELGKLTSNVAFRLHVWPTGFSSEQSDEFLAHDHVYDLTSHVLLGSLEHREYVIAPSDSAAEPLALYEGVYEGSMSILERTDDELKVELVRRMQINRGTTYSIAAQKLHSVTVDPNVFTATVLRTEYPSAPSAPIILGPLHAPVSVCFLREELGLVERTRLLEDLEYALR